MSSTLANGTYTIVSVVSGNPVLDLEGGNAPIANIIAYHSHGGKNQQWKVTQESRGVYSLLSVYSGNTWISIPEDGSTQLTSARYDPLYNDKTRWKITSAGNGYYFIESAAVSGKVVDLQGSVTKDLTPILLYAKHGGSNQQWNFKKVA